MIFFQIAFFLHLQSVDMLYHMHQSFILPCKELSLGNEDGEVRARVSNSEQIISVVFEKPGVSCPLDSGCVKACMNIIIVWGIELYNIH